MRHQYAMLAGYLPFDDDPANPDGDNINLLYKYIVTTPLTFPEYVTPHARDLLRRILVPDPRKRADLFEVARHSWLSEYSHIVSHITSSTTKVSDIANATVPLGMTKLLPFQLSSRGACGLLTMLRPEQQKEPSLARSASVREPQKSYHSPVPTVGGLSHQSGDVSHDQPSEKSKSSRDAKRRTVQVEYVAPQSQTTRGETPTGADSAGSNPSGTDAATFDTRGAVAPQEDVAGEQSAAKAPPKGNMPRPASHTTTSRTAPPLPPNSMPPTTRPTTGGSMASFNAGRLPSRGSYGQPVAPTVAATNAQGRLAQPRSKQYVISAPIPQDPNDHRPTSIGRPSAQPLPPNFNMTPRQDTPKGHKRSNTVSGIGEKLFGRSGSIFGGRSGQAAGGPRQKNGKRYPPTSMKEPFPGDDSRASVDSRRSITGGSSRKYGEMGGENKSRRFSLLPAFSLKGFSSLSRSQTPDEDPQNARSVNNRVQQQPSSGSIRPRARATSYGTQEAMGTMPEGPSDEVFTDDAPDNYQNHIDQQFAALHGSQSAAQQPQQRPSSYGNISAEQVNTHGGYDQYGRHQYANQSAPSYYDAYNNGSHDNAPRQSMQGRAGRGSVLQKNRKFADAYEYEHHPGSSGAARKVMDFFRRRAKSRAGDER